MVVKYMIYINLPHSFKDSIFIGTVYTYRVMFRVFFGQEFGLGQTRGRIHVRGSNFVRVRMTTVLYGTVRLVHII